MEKKTKRANKKNNFEKVMKELISKNIKEPMILKYGSEEEPIEIEVRYAIPFDKQLEMGMIVSELCFLENEETGEIEYTPGMFECTMRHMVLKYYTNVELPDNLNARWAILKHSGIYESVIEFAGDDIMPVIETTKELIEHKKKLLEESKNPLKSILGKVSKIVDSLNVNKDDIKKMVELLKSLDGINPEKIIDALVKDEKTEEPKEECAAK